MSARRDPQSWRDLREKMRALEASAVHLKGSHEVWRFRDGEIFVALVNHLDDDVDANLIAKFRRLHAQKREPVSRPYYPVSEVMATSSRREHEHGRRYVMSKGSSGGKGSGSGAGKGSGRGMGAGSTGGKGGGRGGNWPSTTRNPSGGARGNSGPSK